MSRWCMRVLLTVLPALLGSGCGAPFAAPGASPGAPDLVALAGSGALRSTSRTVAALPAGGRSGVHLSAAEGDGVAWVDGVELDTGTIELMVRGKDVLQQSFLGVAFAGLDDRSYEAVYLRPFNFRAADPTRRDHAVQYVAHPAYTWQKLRAERPEVFENPVAPPPDPVEWVPLRVEVGPSTVRVFVGEGAEPDLVVDRLGTPAGRRVGLWVGNASDGDFSALRVTPRRP